MLLVWAWGRTVQGTNYHHHHQGQDPTELLERHVVERATEEEHGKHQIWAKRPPVTM